MRVLSRLSVVAGAAAGVFASRAIHLEVRGDIDGTWPYVLLAGLFVAAAFALGVPDEPNGMASAVARSAAVALVVSAVVALALVFAPDLLPRFVLLLSAVLMVPILTAATLLDQAVAHRRRVRERVLAVLDGLEAELFRTDTEADFPVPELPFTVVAALGVGDAERGGLRRVAAEHDATLLVLSDAAQQSEDVVSQAAELHRDGVRVRSLVAFYDEWLGKLPLSEISHLALMTDISSVHGTRFGWFKRVVDIIAGVAGLLALVMLLPFVLIGNAIGNQGPLLFRQRRVGLRGSEFVILKLRTMHQADGDDISSWTSPRDPRVTPFGYLLRRSHLDELPQSINMIAGSLSLVGPRPEQPRYVAELAAKLPMYDVRHIVKPGLTGWAQIKFRYASTEADAFEKLQYDLHYIRHQSVSVEVKVVARTVRRILLARGR